MQNRSFIQNCLSVSLITNTIIKIAHLIKIHSSHIAFIYPKQDKLRTFLEPYAAIFNVSGISIVSYDDAVKNNLVNWIV